MPSATMYSGLAQGIAGASETLAGADLKRQQVKEATARSKMAQGQLEEFQANAPSRSRANDLEMQALEANAYSTNAQLTKSQTYDAFRRFNSDSDTRHLNTWLSEVKRNPVGASLYGDVVRADPLTKSTENDQLLRKMGFTDLDGVYNDPELSKDLVLMTGTNQRGLVNINDLYAGTGFTNYLTNEQLDTMERKARVANAMRQGGSAKTVGLQERVAQSLIDSGRAENLADAYEMVKNMERNESRVLTSTEERMIEQIQKEADAAGTPMSTIEALDQYYQARRQGAGETNESRYIEQYLANNPEASYEEAATEYASKTRTSTQKEIKDVDTVKDELDEIQFFDTPMSELTVTNKAKIHRKIAAIEDLRNVKLSNETKREVRNLRDLTALGATAGDELTPEETGLLDSTLNTFKKYMVNEVGGVKGTAAYESFRNIFRNMLYGASLTAGETKAFNKAAGTLGQKFEPVMQQLNTQMSTIKHNLEAIRDLEDPYLAHYYTGQSIEEIDRAIQSIDDRIETSKLAMTKRKSNTPIIVQRVDAQAEPTVPKVEGNVDPSFDFDATMKEAGL